MRRGGYLGGSTVVRPGSSWFGKRVHKSDANDVRAPTPSNIFKLTAEGRKAEQAFLEQLEEERRSMGLSENLTPQKDNVKRRSKRQGKKKAK